MILQEFVMLSILRHFNVVVLLTRLALPLILVIALCGIPWVPSNINFRTSKSIKFTGDAYANTLLSSHKSLSGSSMDSTKTDPLRTHRLIVITPTYKRSTQVPDLMRVKQTLQLVPNCDWVVIEDATDTNPLVHSYLKDFSSGYLFYSAAKTDPKYSSLRGRSQRNLGLETVRNLYESAEKSINSKTKSALEKKRVNPYRRAVVYFADDDNTFDSTFLHLLKGTKTISVFNVGNVANARFEGPIVENNTVVGFQTSWYANRKYAIDMAGFAINIGFLADHNFPSFEVVQPGYQEPLFLAQFNISAPQMEYIHGELGIHVWHTKSVTSKHQKYFPSVLAYWNGTVIDTSKPKNDSKSSKQS
ncbi:galactosylgalactosylxylosylprotein 3-beta-glucuronosyltransferase 3-like isoform X2 [Convolutriloba macropyga]|uniref:galactosylgalactosylxylosylprotein 3-beta-glucuronosyltransferase 3-like isoform X2 n=1 Tax=Convolutriloba macropyga TaxID=536237 RepID=UPI003F52031C